MWVSRRIIRVSWREHKTKEEVLRMLGEERNLITTIKTKENNWKDEDTEGEDGSRC